MRAALAAVLELARLRCDDLPPAACGVAIWSLGPDGKDQTADDVHAKHWSTPGAD